MSVPQQGYIERSAIQFMTGGAETLILPANPERVVVTFGGTTGSSFFYVIRSYGAGSQPFTFVGQSPGIESLSWEKHGLLVCRRITVELVTISANFSWYELQYRR